ncbi:hypothetical protein ABQG65_21310 [Yersinia alsatica]|uniref:hypothetical protein n=1 Tax=Yersinia alsatica TaxID=2890317 RepID=UPI000B40F113|nr:hypothetical protein CBW58_15410 [Yersinia frederiksenii]
MKLLIIGSMIIFSSTTHAAPTIQPSDNERSYALVNNFHSRINTFLDYKNKNYDVKQKICNYSINDYRHLKDSEIGCAVNNNRKKSSKDGGICN